MTDVTERVRTLHARSEALGLGLTPRQILLSPEGALRSIEAEVRFQRNQVRHTPSGPRLGFRQRGIQRPIR
jgi:hypothetical protein